ncbi:hypothetical protein FHL15_005215 [Xylaria flabelliformis]|uniref:Uncharacterized protein n=1 Tax=Xylaria flabelliformis TaxID=2512241 RepID=A0A553I0V4_9PEZI|nr:hypothetical protein FHL15_005215 [Xylaria flabelliformis]
MPIQAWGWNNKSRSLMRGFHPHRALHLGLLASKKSFTDKFDSITNLVKCLPKVFSGTTYKALSILGALLNRSISRSQKTKETNSNSALERPCIFDLDPTTRVPPVYPQALTPVREPIAFDVPGIVPTCVVDRRAAAPRLRLASYTYSVLHHTNQVVLTLPMFLYIFRRRASTLAWSVKTQYQDDEHCTTSGGQEPRGKQLKDGYKPSIASKCAEPDQLKPPK